MSGVWIVRLFFGSKREQSRQFLQILQKRINPREFDLLRTEGGFTDPNEYLPIEEITRVLNNYEFPGEGFYEFEWAIYECEFDCLRKYSIWMQALLASLYVYCNKRKQWGITIDSNYHYLIISLVLDEPQKKDLALSYLAFLEWLHDHVEADIGYENYFSLLTWTLLRRLTGLTNHPRFQKVVDILLKKNYSTDVIETLTVSDLGIEAWYELHQKIPCPSLLKKQFDQIIRGKP